MIDQAIKQVVEGLDLAPETMTQAMEQIMGGQAQPASIAAFLVGLRLKGETVDEISAAAAVMRALATRLSPAAQGRLVDTCGTGGDGASTFNISTAAAFVTAAAGAPVAKHGNRAVSSSCGSADVMEALGVSLEMTPEKVGKAIEQVGIGFMFAPLFHGAMRHAMPVRREIGVRTVFNVLGPLTNPAGAENQLLGVFAPELTEKLAGVLAALGSREAMVVHGAGGLDELSTLGPTQVAHLKDGRVTSYEVRAGELGLKTARPDDLAGGDAGENARLIRAIFSGEKGPKRDIVLLNAAAALTVAGLAGNLAQGVELAAKTIDSGAAQAKVDELAAFSRNGNQ